MWRAPTTALAATMLVTGCGASADAPRPAPSAPADAPRPAPSASSNARATEPSASEESHRTARDSAAEAPPERPSVDRAHCAPSAANCAAVTGRVLYVEAVDPDGDGDAHYVLVGGHVTAPGVSVIDVERRLRPRRLPRAGDLVSAAGPVYTGSYGQRQIQAVELRYSRR